MPKDPPLYVTKPYLPPLEEFLPYLETIWKTRRLTNKGPFHQQLEKELAEYLGVSELALFSNGTTALVTALQALRITGKVITTPYSFVATSHALLWNNIEPVFVDIDPRTCNLDPRKIEAAITPQTTAILAVHCYGNPCAVDEIQQVADIYGLRVIYDAAHAFGVRYCGKSLLNHGDLSVLSFHATKVFNTFEGGAIVCPDAKMKQRIDYLKNFGFADEVTVMAPGINGKMSEFQAALGLLQLKHIDWVIARRRAIDRRYRTLLEGVSGISCLEEPENTERNYAYLPLLIDDDYSLSRDALYRRLKAANVFPRRYFYPLISTFPMYRGLPSSALSNLPRATSVAERIICLPMYPELQDEEIERVAAMIAAPGRS